MKLSPTEDIPQDRYNHQEPGRYRTIGQTTRPTITYLGSTTVPPDLEVQNDVLSHSGQAALYGHQRQQGGAERTKAVGDISDISDIEF